MGNLRAIGRTILQGIRYGGLTKEEYKTIESDIYQKNCTTALLSSAIAAVLLLCLSVAALLLPSIRDNIRLYLIFSGLFTAIFLFALLVVRRKPHLSLWLIYVMIGAAFAFGIYLGICVKSDIPATTFCVLLFALPLLLVDRPGRSSLMVILATVCFCVCAVKFESAAIAEQELINSISFLLLGLAVNLHVTKTKLRDLLNQNFVARERDTDHLTGLLTSAAGRRAIEGYLAYDPAPAAFAILDIDTFKAFNDTYGHAYGDTVLRMVGESIRQVFRDSDVLIRMGGDEFLLFLPGMTRREQVDECLRRLMEAIRNSAAGEPLSALTLSVGVAVFPTDSMSYDTLYRMADRALYAAKDGGRNRCVYFSQLPPTPAGHFPAS